MKYEISREIFKQRLEDRHNFVFINLAASSVKFDNVVDLTFTDGFASKFSSQYPDKAQNIILYSLNKGDRSPEKAAHELSSLGYQFVYYYLGSDKDKVLDQGMN